jgi:hypothetical protein
VFWILFLSLIKVSLFPARNFMMETPGTFIFSQFIKKYFYNWKFTNLVQIIKQTMFWISNIFPVRLKMAPGISTYLISDLLNSSRILIFIKVYPSQTLLLAILNEFIETTIHFILIPNVIKIIN